RQPDTVAAPKADQCHMKITRRYQAKAAVQFVLLARFAHFKSAQFIQMLSHASGKIGGICCTTAMGGSPAGHWGRRKRNASTPPVEAPMRMIRRAENSPRGRDSGTAGGAGTLASERSGRRRARAAALT